MQELPYKIEQDRFGRIVMSPLKYRHGFIQSEIAATLRSLMPDWKVSVACAVDTAEGTRVPDVVEYNERGQIEKVDVNNINLTPSV